MALLGNYSVLNKSLAQFTNGTATAGAYAGVTPSNYQNNGLKINRFGGPTGFADHSAIPVGYIPPYSFALPKKSGGLASLKTLTATLTETDAQLALGINLDAGLSASFTEVDAILALIVALEAQLSATGSFTDAQLAIILLLESQLSASGTFTQAQLNNILGLVAQLSATMTVTNSITNLVNLSADIGGPTELSPEGLANAVWNAVAADNNDAGTMGEKLNDAGAAGNPWAANLADNVAPGTFGAFIQKLLTVAKFLGLK